MPRNDIAKLMKQKNIPWLGAFVDALYTSLPILSIINFLSILIVLYATIKPYLERYAPWLTIWLFLILFSFAVAVFIITVYKFVVPSMWAFRSRQMFDHESSVSDKLDQLDKKLDQLNEKLDNDKDNDHG